MATVGDAASLAYQARRVYTEELVKGLPTLINFVANWAASPERSTTTTTDAWQLQRIRDLVADMRQRGAAWYLEGTDGSGGTAFRLIVTWGGKRPYRGGSSYKNNELGDIRDEVVVQAKKICETVAL